MADYFTHFSCLLDVGAAEKAARAINFFVALQDEDDQSDEPQFHGFDLSRQDGPDSSILWTRDDDSGNVENVIAVVLRLAEELDLTGLWGFEHSNTCSRPRLDAFGGGAHVTDLGARKCVGWVNTQTWLAAALTGGGHRCLKSFEPRSASSQSCPLRPRTRPAAGIANLGFMTPGGMPYMTISSASAKSSASASKPEPSA